MEMIYGGWPWYVSGPLVAFTMLLLILAGKRFGMSANLETICAIGGAGRISDYFKFDWKERSWGLIVMVGAVIGGFIAANYLTPDPSVAISESTVEGLKELGFTGSSTYLPQEIFGTEAMASFKGIVILIVAGLLIGFGTRYAGGCTSGHAISGLSNLQLPSLISVIGFFIGGLIMVHLLLPMIFN